MSMEERARRELHDWLAAEREGRDTDADARFAALLAGRVPHLRPSPGLADRVMRRRRRQAPLAVGWRLPAWWARAALVAVVVGVGAAGATFWSVFDLARLAGGLLPTLRALGVAGVSGLAAVGQAVAVVASVGRAFALAASSGPAAAVIALNLALALSASLALKRLVALEEE